MLLIWLTRRLTAEKALARLQRRCALWLMLCVSVAAHPRTPLGRPRHPHLAGARSCVAPPSRCGTTLPTATLSLRMSTSACHHPSQNAKAFWSTHRICGLTMEVRPPATKTGCSSLPMRDPRPDDEQFDAHQPTRIHIPMHVPIRPYKLLLWHEGFPLSQSGSDISVFKVAFSLTFSM